MLQDSKALPRFGEGLSWWCIVRFMDYILGILFLITATWLYFKLRPTRPTQPLHKEDIEERKRASGALTRQGLPADTNEGSKPKSYFSDIAGDE